MIPKDTESITLEWLNDVLDKSGFLKGNEIESFTNERMGIGFGLIGNMAKLTFKYKKDITAANLPETAVAKWPPADEAAFNLGMQFRIFEREIRFYTEVAPKSRIRVPKLYYADYDLENKRFGLLIEDCSKYTAVDQIIGLNYDQTKKAILAIADFQARWWDSDDLFSFEFMPKPYGSVSETAVAVFKMYWDLCRNNEVFKTMVPEGSIEVGDIIKEKFDWLYLSKEAIPEENFTISHFDYRADNMFFDDKNEEQPVIMIDLGNAVITGGILDVAYLLAFSIPIELRRKIEKEMVQVYIDRLLERGAKLTDLSFDRAWTFYCRCLMSNLFLLVLAFVNGDLSSERSKKLIEVGLKRCFAAIIENEVITALPP